MKNILATLFFLAAIISLVKGGKPIKIGSTESKEYYIDEDSIHETVDFEGFMRNCHDQGMGGATIKNLEEQRIIEDFYNSTNFTSHFRLAGINPDSGGVGNWTWLDDYTTINDNYKNWDDGQPDGQEKGENCLVLYKNTTKWHDFPCSLSPGYKALCQVLL